MKSMVILSKFFLFFRPCLSTNRDRELVENSGQEVTLRMMMEVYLAKIRTQIAYQPCLHQGLIRPLKMILSSSQTLTISPLMDPSCRLECQYIFFFKFS